MKHTVKLTQVAAFYDSTHTIKVRFSRQDSAYTSRVTWHNMTWKQWARFAVRLSNKFGTPTFRTMAYTKRTMISWSLI